MKKIVRAGIFLWLTASLVVVSGAEEETDIDWIQDQIKVTSTETFLTDLNGQITRRTAVTDASVSARKKVTETLNLDKAGNTRSIQRKTEIFDTASLGVAPILTLMEETEKESDALVVKSITTVTKTSTGTVTTVQTRDKSGILVPTRRTVWSKSQKGMETTTVEVPDKSGNLVVTQTTIIQHGE